MFSSCWCGREGALLEGEAAETGTAAVDDVWRYGCHEDLLLLRGLEMPSKLKALEICNNLIEVEEKS